jgi:WD40 repeat protein
MMQHIESDTSLLVSGSDDCTVRVWNTINGKLKHTLSGHNRAVNSVKISSDNTMIASGGDDCDLIIWDANSGKIIHRLKDHTQCINSICFTHNDKIIASGSDDMSIKIWNPIKGELINTLTEHAKYVHQVLFSPDDEHLLSLSNRRTIKIWDYLGGKIIRQFDINSKIYDICFSPSGKYLAIIDSKNIKIWDTKSLTLRILNETQEEYISRSLIYEFSDYGSISLSFASDTVLLSRAPDNEICVFDNNDVKDPWNKKSNIHDNTDEPARGNGQVMTINYSLTQDIIATSSDDNMIKLWEYNEDQYKGDDNGRYKLKKILCGHTYHVNSLMLSQYKDELLGRLREYHFEKNMGIDSKKLLQ